MTPDGESYPGFSFWWHQMILRDYLELRNPRHAKALTNAEAAVIGVVLKRGWTGRYANVSVPEELANAVSSGVRGKVALGAIAKKICNDEHIIVQEVQVVTKDTSNLSGGNLETLRNMEKELLKRGLLEKDASVKGIDRSAIFYGIPNLAEKFSVEFGFLSTAKTIKQMCRLWKARFKKTKKSKGIAGLIAAQMRKEHGRKSDVPLKEFEKPGPVHITTGFSRVDCGNFTDEFIASKEFLLTYEWRRVRMVALKKYGARCQCCGATPATGAVMNVDHIKPRRLFPELALDVDNLQVLCHECNHGKGNWDNTDWR